MESNFEAINKLMRSVPADDCLMFYPQMVRYLNKRYKNGSEIAHIISVYMKNSGFIFTEGTWADYKTFVNFDAPSFTIFEPTNYLLFGASFKDVKKYVDKLKCDGLVIRSKYTKDPESLYVEFNIDKIVAILKGELK